MATAMDIAMVLEIQNNKCRHYHPEFDIRKYSLLVGNTLNACVISLCAIG